MISHTSVRGNQAIGSHLLSPVDAGFIEKKKLFLASLFLQVFPYLSTPYFFCCSLQSLHPHLLPTVRNGVRNTLKGLTSFGENVSTPLDNWGHSLAPPAFLKSGLFLNFV